MRSELGRWRGVGDGLAVAVVEQGLGAGLGEAGELGIDGALEAVGVGLEVEGAGEEVGVFGESLGVGGRDAADGGEVFLDAGLFEAGLGEVLGGADEDAGAAADGGAEGAEVAAGLGREEEDGLLGLGGDGDDDAFLADFFVPGLDAVNQSSGGGLVVPRRKTRREGSGRTGWAGGRGGARACRRAGGWGPEAMGRVLPARVTRTSILGPVRSKRAASPCVKQRTDAGGQREFQRVAYVETHLPSFHFRRRNGSGGCTGDVVESFTSFDLDYLLRIREER